MSRSIWTQCAGDSELRPLQAEAFRAVESQHLVATRKLVDSAEEQELLEELVDRVKPPAPTGARFAGLHYLLATPFRHPPLRNGSRFGGRFERGIWYGARSLETCFAEVAYYRFVFLAGTEARLTPLATELTTFAAQVRARRGVDLTREPFVRHARALTSRTAFVASQALGGEMRRAGVEAFLFTSARCPKRGTNVGLFEPAFGRKAPSKLSMWHCVVDEGKVEIREKGFGARRAVHEFLRASFLVGGALPTPAV